VPLFYFKFYSNPNLQLLKSRRNPTLITSLQLKSSPNFNHNLQPTGTGLTVIRVNSSDTVTNLSACMHTYVGYAFTWVDMGDTKSLILSFNTVPGCCHQKVNRRIYMYQSSNNIEENIEVDHDPCSVVSKIISKIGLA